MFDAALGAADPAKALLKILPQRPKGRVVVLGAGKASAPMVQALESQWGACEGLVAVPHGATLPTKHIELIEASHPVPDATSETAARRMLDMALGLGEGDTLIMLMSGGGSALLAAPATGIDLADKQNITRALLASGAPIDQMNCVRSALSAIKGGRLAAAAAPAKIVTYIVSDVPGDDPARVASGPSLPPPASSQDPLAILQSYQIDISPEVRAVLDAHRSPAVSEGEAHVIATAQHALEAAAIVARDAGVTPVILGDAIEGESSELGKVLAGVSGQIARHGQPAAMPAVLISGGETTVTVRDKAGKGGRCSEFLLAYALAAHEQKGVSAIACDTDGRDGSEHNAGAIWHSHAPFDTREARKLLAAHDAYSFFANIDGLIQTGPTHTNVNDFRAILVQNPGT